MNTTLDDWSRYLIGQLAIGKTWEACKAEHRGIEDSHLAHAASTALNVIAQAEPLIQEEQRRQQHEARTRDLKRSNPKHGSRWTEDESAIMCDLWMSGKSFEDIGAHLDRTAGAIRARLHKFGLVDEDGEPLVERRKMKAHQLEWHVDDMGHWMPVPAQAFAGT